MFEFLEHLMKDFECIIYTTEKKEIALALKKYFQRKKKWLKYFLDETHCLEGLLPWSCKSLEYLTPGRGIENILLVDDKIGSFCLHMENSLPIQQYDGSSTDSLLPKLSKFLELIKSSSSIPSIIKPYLTNILS